ncbi:MAG: bifunctional riboflavin kinase/FAD synthetase [Flavobacteriaceae bacterium]|nr:bifunctional riboflavin kinase/FAD synthetase [Flavobacteriaceae bacterium]
MKTFHGLEHFKTEDKTIITIGTFDGVHIGHQKVIKKLLKTARKKNRPSVLLSFFPHPRMVLQKEAGIKLLNTIDERAELLEKTGLKNLVIIPFNKEFSRLTALDFVRKILVNTLNISRLLIGYDHQFGKNREGNFEQLTEYGHTYGFKVDKIEALDIDRISISSTKIRTALENGNIQKANTYLGYNYMLSGTVVKGHNLGEKIGYPTANLHIAEAYKLIPKTGAYISKSYLNGAWVYGMTNIGYRPTVNGKHQTIETHFFNFKDDLYGRKIRIHLLDYLRDEQKFDSVVQLKNQLLNDKKTALEIIASIPKT